MQWTVMATAEQTFPIARPRYTGILEWITTTDHKKIGVLYLFTTFFFFLSGGLLALAMRTHLATPDGHILTAQQYNAAFTMHGTTMIFLFVVPVWTGFANYMIPLQIGARDMAFPKLNALSYWLLLADHAVHLERARHIVPARARDPVPDGRGRAAALRPSRGPELLRDVGGLR